MSDTTQSNRPLWHQHLTYGQVEAEAEKDYAKVVYNLHEDCLCLCEELAALKIENGFIIGKLLAASKATNPIAIDTLIEEAKDYANKIEDGS